MDEKKWKPKSIPVKKGGGYPVDDLDRYPLPRKGKWPPEAMKKTHKASRGYGAAKKGYKFFDVD